MKAAYRTKYGESEVLSVREIDIPKPGDEEILIKVAATTVNRTDCANLTGKPLIMHLIIGLFTPKNPVPGTDFSGVVAETGKNVSRFEKGDHVWGFKDNGCSSQAEFMCISEKGPVEKAPANISLTSLAACIEGAHYAINFLNKVKIKEGNRIMVNGGTGAIGSAMIQLLKVKGCHITATCRGMHADLVQDLGAERTIDYEKEDFTKDDEEYDFVFDSVGKSTFGACSKLLKPKGTYISSELGPNAQNPFLALATSLTGSKTVKFPIPLDTNKSLQEMNTLIENGYFKPLIDRILPLEQAAEAYAYVLSGQKAGNVILQIDRKKP